MEIVLKLLETAEEAALLAKLFEEKGMRRDEGYFVRCLEENRSGVRVTLLGYGDGLIAGCAHLLMMSAYPLFADNGIPEINDLNVFPEFRRQGIAGAMLDEFEVIAAARGCARIGIGVGLYKDYGSAQRLYCRKGYIPDGTGVKYANRDVPPGDRVCLDDDLVLYSIKELG